MSWTDCTHYTNDDADSLPRRRALIRYCVDWSEQRHHIAGSRGAALADRMLELRWIRCARSGRAACT